MRHTLRPLGLAVVVWLAAWDAAAQTTTSESASLLLFPKVIVNSSWDTTIQLGNQANRPARATCYYVNGAPTNPDLPPGPINPTLWSQVDFNLSLSRQQPTSWLVSRGRPLSDQDGTCDTPFETCYGTGFDPGLIPPVEPTFTGELICYETDASGAPWSGNALTGYATLTHRETGEVVKYPAVGATGLPANNGNGTLCLGGAFSESCPLGAEYRGCPRDWTASHRLDYDDSGSGGDISRTNLTVVPCGHDFATQEPTRMTLQFAVINELEQRFTTSATVACWEDFQLGEMNAIFNRDIIGSDWAQTRVRLAASTPGGFAVVQQTQRGNAAQPLLTAVASVPQQSPSDAGVDLIRVPEEGGQ